MSADRDRARLAEQPAPAPVPLVAETAWGAFDPEDGLLRTVPDAVMAEFEREARNHSNLWTSGNEAARQSFQVAVAKAWIGGVQSAGCVLAEQPAPAGTGADGVDDLAKLAEARKLAAAAFASICEARGYEALCGDPSGLAHHLIVAAKALSEIIAPVAALDAGSRKEGR